MKRSDKFESSRKQDDVLVACYIDITEMKFVGEKYLWSVFDDIPSRWWRISQLWNLLCFTGDRLKSRDAQAVREI